jgi:sugar phosphate isomerase/epimerase
MKRRKFISNISLATITTVLGPSIPASFRKKQSIGLLLGSVEKYMNDDPEGTLQKISAIGYKGLEYPRTYGHDVYKLKKIINKNKLHSIGGGNTRNELTVHFSDYAKEYNTLGKKYVFCYWPWLDGGKNKTIEDWKRNAEEFNKLGKKFKDEGLRLAYHNHDIEFIETEKQIPYDIILQYTDPELLAIQMDIWWIRKGGRDPLEYITNYPGRFEVCHIKTAEILNNNEEVQNLNYKEVLAKSSVAGFKHFILENEPGIAEPFAYFEKSYRYIMNLF